MNKYRRNILKCLYDANKVKPSQSYPLGYIKEHTSFDITVIQRETDYLAQKGYIKKEFVRTPSFVFYCRITAQGIDEIESKLDHHLMKNKKIQKERKGIFGLALAILIPICGFYAYQYFWLPEINIKSVYAQYARATKANDMRIIFSFKFKNDGKSKTKNLKLFSAFPKWSFNGKNITVSPYDFVQNDLADLMGGEDIDYEMYKDINVDDFIQNHNMAQGIWLTLVLRWNSDNLAYVGRTFEKHILIFLTQGMKENKIIFMPRQVKEKDFTHWFQKNEKKPNIFKIIEDLEASRLLYGDTSRFD